MIEAYKELKQLSLMSVKFGLPDVTIWRRCKKLGLSFSNQGFQDKIELSEILEGNHPQYQTFKLKNKLLKEGIFENKCSVCGITEWNGKELKMQLDHIDGNGNNHLFENLRMVCPNCHSQTSTYCGKNKRK